jgi:hypothetical protein
MQAVAARPREAVGAQPTSQLLEELLVTVGRRWSSNPVELRRYFGELADELGDEFRLFVEEIVWSSGLEVPPISGAALLAPEPEPEPESEVGSGADAEAEPELELGPELGPEPEPEPEPELAEILQDELDSEPDPEVRGVLQENQTLRCKIAHRDDEIDRITRRLAEVRGVAARRPQPATARPCSAPATGTPSRKCPTSDRRPASARKDAKYSRMYVRDRERRAALDAATAAAREQQMADEMKEATFSPKTKPHLPAWYRRVNPSINLRPKSEVRASIRAPSKPSGVRAAKSTQPSARRPLRLQQPQATTARRFRGKQTVTRPRRAADEISNAGVNEQAAESIPAPHLTQAAATPASEQPLEPPNTAELEQLGWGTATLADGQRYWYKLNEPAVLRWDPPSQ